MSTETETQGLLPVVPFLKIPEDGSPHLEGTRCKACDAVFLGAKETCSKCGARDGMKTETISTQGELYVYSIVHRSFPGIEVPYVSAIVDLEGGYTVKGNLIDVDPEPEKVKMGMPVELIFKKAPTKDRDGNEYLAYYFKPRN